MTTVGNARELWIFGLGKNKDRGAHIRSYLTMAAYRARPAAMADLEKEHPLGILLDLSPFSEDGWGTLLDIKINPLTRNIPILPIYLSEEGKVGGVFPVAGFFTLPIDADYLAERLAVLGLTEEAEDYDLQALIVSRRGEEKVAKTLTGLSFEVVNAYNGKEALALATTGRQYLACCSLMLADMSAFDLLERLRLYPQTRNVPFFVLLKDVMKEGEKKAMSRQIEYLVRKKELSAEEFLVHFRKRI
ncbi:MAG TPA: response regulator [Geobacteraceae bacterium]|nr:response regulator [Geobacteraceae bacterium]